MMAHHQWPIQSQCRINKLASMILFSFIRQFLISLVVLSMLVLSACTTTPPAPVVSSYSPTAGFDPLTANIANSIAVPYLSFLIIEPDALAKDGIPPQIEKLIRAKQFKEAIDQIDLALVKNPRNVQLRFLANLGDIYIRLAAKNYEAAAKLSPSIREYARRNKALQEILKPPLIKAPLPTPVKPAAVPGKSAPSSSLPSNSAPPISAPKISN